MADRVQVPNQIARPALRPAAQPVDTFVVPEFNQNAGQGWRDLANALSDVNPALIKYGKDEIEEDNRLGEAEGERLQREGIDLPPGARQSVMRGYKRSQLRNKMYSYNDEMRAAYAESPASESNDPAEVQKFVQEFTEGWMRNNLEPGEYDDVMLQGTAFPIMDRSQNELAARHVEQRIAAVEDGVKDSLALEAEQLIAKSLDEAGPEGPDWTSLGNFLTEIGANHVANGVSGTDLNKTLVDTITLRAREEHDPNVLRLLDKIRTPTGTVGATRYAREERAEAEAWLAGEEVRMEKLDVWRRDQYRKEVTRQMSGAGIQALIENPYININEFSTRLSEVDPDAARTMLSFQQTMQASEVQVDEFAPEIAAVYENISNAGSQSEANLMIMEAANDGIIASGTVESLFRFAERSQSSANKGLWATRWWKDFEGDAEGMVKGNEFEFSPAKRYLARRLKLELRDFAMDWREDNADENGRVSESKFRQEMDKELERLVRSPRFGVGEDINSTLNYLGDDDDTAPSEEAEINPFLTPEMQSDE